MQYLRSLFVVFYLAACSPMPLDSPPDMASKKPDMAGPCGTIGHDCCTSDAGVPFCNQVETLPEIACGSLGSDGCVLCGHDGEPCCGGVDVPTSRRSCGCDLHCRPDAHCASCGATGQVCCVNRGAECDIGNKTDKSTGFCLCQPI